MIVRIWVDGPTLTTMNAANWLGWPILSLGATIRFLLLRFGVWFNQLQSGFQLSHPKLVVEIRGDE